MLPLLSVIVNLSVFEISSNLESNAPCKPVTSLILCSCPSSETSTPFTIKRPVLTPSLSILKAVLPALSVIVKLSVSEISSNLESNAPCKPVTSTIACSCSKFSTSSNVCVWPSSETSTPFTIKRPVLTPSSFTSKAVLPLLSDIVKLSVCVITSLVSTVSLFIFVELIVFAFIVFIKNPFSSILATALPFVSVKTNSSVFVIISVTSNVSVATFVDTMFVALISLIKSPFSSILATALPFVSVKTNSSVFVIISVTSNVSNFAVFAFTAVVVIPSLSIFAMILPLLSTT